MLAAQARNVFRAAGITAGLAGSNTAQQSDFLQHCRGTLVDSILFHCRRVEDNPALGDQEPQL